jgi:acylphosphatase
MKTVDVIVSGRVQMVGFRAFTRKNALLLGVRGFVENLPDGSVHAVVEGEGHQVDKLIEALRHGPPSAQVRTVRVKPADRAGYRNFDIL